MDNYDNLGTIGEGTYGVVLKGRHKATGQVVAIKKFKESDEDEQVRKTALREIKILKLLKQDNIVSLLEVFRRNRKLYLVFEYVERTILEDLEKNPSGMDKLDVKKVFYQLLRALDFIHSNNIVHRDIKPENLLMSKNGVLKLCDFGFARSLSRPGSKYTDYVATRWYRAPELLVGDTEYGKAVDIWAAGCMFAEISTGMPLFPGESDIDQLCHIMKCFGPLTARHMEIFSKNPLYVGVKLPTVKTPEPLEKRFPNMDKTQLSLLKKCLKYDPEERATAAQLLQHPYFSGFTEWYEHELKAACSRDRDEHDALHQQTRKLLEKKTPMPVLAGALSPLLSPEATPMGSPHGISSTAASSRVDDDGAPIDDTKRRAGGGAAAAADNKTPREDKAGGEARAGTDDEFEEDTGIDYDDDDEKPSGGHKDSMAAPPVVPSNMTPVPPLPSTFPSITGVISSLTALPSVRRAATDGDVPASSPSTVTSPPIPALTTSSGLTSGVRSPMVSPRVLPGATTLPATIAGSTPRQHYHGDKQQPPSQQAAVNDGSLSSREPASSSSLGASLNADGSESRSGSPRSRAQSRVEAANASSTSGASPPSNDHGAAPTKKRSKGQSNSISSMADAKRGAETERRARERERDREAATNGAAAAGGAATNSAASSEAASSRAVGKMAEGALPNIKQGAALPLLTSAASMELADGPTTPTTDAKEEIVAASNDSVNVGGRHSPTGRKQRKGEFPFVKNMGGDARKGAGVFPTLVDSKPKKGHHSKKIGSTVSGAGTGALLAGIGLPATPHGVNVNVAVTTGPPSNGTTAGSGLLPPTGGVIPQPPKSSPSPFERSESVMYRKQRTGGVAGDAPFVYKGSVVNLGGVNAVAVAATGIAGPPKAKPKQSYYPKQPPTLQAVPRRF